jgi:hypothetical protein
MAADQPDRGAWWIVDTVVVVLLRDRSRGSRSLPFSRPQ